MPSPLLDFSPVQEKTNHGIFEASGGDVQLVAPVALRSLKGAFGNLSERTVYHWVTDGAWSLHDLICFVVQTKGPCRLAMTTWSLTEPPLRALMRLKEVGLLTGAQCLLSERISERSPGAFQFAREVFDELRLVRLHAKIAILTGEGWSCSIVGSANLTRNPRFEAGVLDTHPEVGQFYEQWIHKQLECAGKGTP